MNKKEFKNLGGGATLLTARSACFGGAVWEKLLRYYGTKALRSKYCVPLALVYLQTSSCIYCGI